MVDMSGKVILVTGATNGIGKVAACELTRMGATVVLVGRNPEKTERAISEIKQYTGSKFVHSLIADLSVMDQVRTLAADFKREFDRLDVLLNNAGAYFSKRQETADGYEMTFALNHLNYFLLTNLLLDVLKASAPSRVINVSSDAHRMVKGIDFDNLDGKKSWGLMGFAAYGQSKLANILFTRELARQLAGTGVTANALHPGTIASGFGQNNNNLLGNLFYKTIAPIILKSPEEGATTPIYLATSPEVQNVSGQYFVDARVVEPSKAAQDEEAARRLWKISAEMTGLTVAV